jgi:hypothetical protein
MLFHNAIVASRPDDHMFLFCCSAIAQRNGREAGRLMLDRARLQNCQDPEGFVQAMDELVRSSTSVRCA